MPGQGLPQGLISVSSFPAASQVFIYIYIYACVGVHIGYNDIIVRVIQKKPSRQLPFGLPIFQPALPQHLGLQLCSPGPAPLSEQEAAELRLSSLEKVRLLYEDTENNALIQPRLG